MAPFLSPSVPNDRLDVVRVYLYARQSKARADGSDVSTESQLAAGHAVVASRNAQGGNTRWEVVGEFVDKGRSGWDPNVIRADFERMMTGVRAGEADVVAVNELSRLTRQGAHDALEIDNEFKRHGVRFMSVLEPFLDTSSPIGVAIFALIAALAKQDSDLKAERLKGAKDEIAALGGVHSSSAPFGMRTAREKVGNLVISVLEPDEDNPKHVELVERMAAMSYDGVSDNKIATTFEKEQIPSPGMAEKRATERRLASIKARRLSGEDSPIQWRAQTVRWILNHPAIGGFAFERVKHGKAHINVIRRDETGAPLTPHRGILTGARWLEVQEKRGNPTNPTRKPGNDEVAPTLLSGWRFTTCGICHGSMGQSPGSRKRNGELSDGVYMCSNPKGHGGLAIKRAEIDEYVAQRVWARLSAADMEDAEDQAWVAAAAERFALQKDLAGVTEERRDTQAHLDNVVRSIADLQADRKAGLYQGRDELETWRATVLQYRAYETQCIERLAELDETLTTSIQVPTEWFSGPDPLAKTNPWSKWDVFERRAFLDLFLDGVSVGPGRDPVTKQLVPVRDRVALKWTSLPEPAASPNEAAEAELAAL
ncbi:recombinase family protein [Streptomyces anulatus]|uniref:recombinase family protein n=1 Tax=Streptomyces anulatus TaxID=1892 RepID=UPI00365E8D9F